MKYIIILIIGLIFITGCTCVEKDTECCKGPSCGVSSISCTPGLEAVFHGCDKDCTPEWTCEPDTCLQVETTGYNPDTGECIINPDSCLPEGYIKYDPEAGHECNCDISEVCPT